MTALQPQVILISSSPEGSGVTIVISPLIALMQVDALARRIVSDACLDSTLPQSLSHSKGGEAGQHADSPIL